MDRLWAPWRTEYVRMADKDETCFLCDAFNSDDDRGNYVLWRDEQCFCMVNRYPYNNGHLLIAPVAHKSELVDLSEEEIAAQMRMLRRCLGNLAKAVSPHGYNVGLNLGRAAGAGVVEHMHWHVVPRWTGDSNFMPVVGDTKVIPQSLDALWQLLREVDPQ